MRSLGPLPLAVLFTCSVTLFTGTSAFADEEWPQEEETVRREPDVRTRWYGEQTLLADGGALTLLGVTAAAQRGYALPALGAFLYGLGAPVVHLAHGHGLKALADLGLRATVPLAMTVGALIGASDSASGLKGLPSWYANLYVGAIIGGVIATISASTLDAAILAREPLSKTRHASVPTPPSKPVAWTPTVMPVAGGASAGVVGTF